MSRLNTNIDFLIVTALDFERDAVIEQIGNFETIQIDDEIPTYYQTEIHLPNKIETYKVTLVVLLGVGNVQAGVLSEKIIEKLHPKHVIMFGIAGGILKNEVKIGDIVVGTSIGYYEKGKFFSKKLQVRIEGALSDALLIDRLKNFKDNNWIDEISIKPPENPYNPNIHFGLIASGEKVVASKRFIKRLLKYFPKMLAVEMESWGVLIAAWMSKPLPRFIPVRGISDNADKLKGDKWQKLAAHTAALYLKHFLQSQPVIPSMGNLPKEFKWIDQVYVPPLEFKEISKTLEEKRIVLITGTPEYGKTFTAIYLMWKYYKSGYKPEWIRGGDRAERLGVRSRLQKIMDLELEKKKILYFEDPFGSTKYEESDLERKITSIIEEIKNKKNLHVIITSREEVFKEFKKKALSGTRLEAFEKRLSIKKPSYTPKKRKKILTNWATLKKCTWLNNKELKNFVLDLLENEYILPTPLNIREFVGASININLKEQLVSKIKEKSIGTTYAFCKEIKEMTKDKALFLTILYILKDAREEFVKETYQNLVLRLNLENARKFNDVFNWFKEDKIKITSQNRIEFSHPSYFEAMKDLISEGDDYDEIFIRLLKYLAGKEEIARDVVSAIIDNFDKLPENIRQILFTLAEKDEAASDVAYAIAKHFNELPENVREQLLLTLVEKDGAIWDVAFATRVNFNELPENVREQLLLTLAEKDDAASEVAFVIAENFNELPENVREQLLLTLAEKDDAIWDVTYIIGAYFNELPENVREQLLLTLAEKDDAAWDVAFVLGANFNELPENVREQLLLTLAEKDDAACDVAFVLGANFNELPENVREQLLLTLADKDGAIWDVAFAIAKHFNELPENLKQILFTLAEKDGGTWAVAFAIAKHFNELPENLKQILFTLAEKDGAARAVAFAIAKYFDNLPETIRYKLLLNLSNIKSAQKIVANILKLRDNQIPELVRKGIRYRLKFKDEED